MRLVLLSEFRLLRILWLRLALLGLFRLDVLRTLPLLRPCLLRLSLLRRLLLPLLLKRIVLLGFMLLHRLMLTLPGLFLRMRLRHGLTLRLIVLHTLPLRRVRHYPFFGLFLGPGRPLGMPDALSERLQRAMIPITSHLIPDLIAVPLL